ncbi:MAG: DUF4258 domain-containing protein [Solirubrobacterales bacterium]
MRFTRHARSEMRLYGVSRAEATRIAAEPTSEERDNKGNARRAGLSDDGREIVVVVARDDPALVITLFERG